VARCYRFSRCDDTRSRRLLIRARSIEPRFDIARARHLLLGLGGICILAGTLLGVDLNSRLTFHPGVPNNIFVVYCCVLFAGVPYVLPPFHFYRRAGGETVISVTLGLAPVLGAYLVQVGDLTRTVYVASSPLVAATAQPLLRRPGKSTAGQPTCT
jgi:1,4-dihydroxy-2-naphthoate octaprenyltransferase